MTTSSNRLPRWYVKAVWFTIFAVVVSIGAWYVASKLTDLMITVAMCFFIAFAVEPAVNRLGERGWKRGRATLLVYGIGLGVIVAFGALFGQLLISQLVDIMSRMPALYADLQAWIGGQFGVVLPEPSSLVNEYWDDAVQTVANSALTVVGGALAFVFGTLTVLLVTFYLVTDGPKFRRAVCSMLPQQRQREVLAVWDVAIDKTSSYIVSRLTLAIVCGTATTLFLFLIQVDNALVLGVMTGAVSAFVPTIGTYIGGLLPIVMALGESMWQGAATLLFVVAYQQVENLTIEPRVSARAMELNTAVSFLSVLAGAAILGPIGAVLALPFAATVKAFVGTYLRRNEVVENALTVVTD